MADLHSKLLESLLNFGINEDDAPKKNPVKNKTRDTATDNLGNIFKNKPDQPLTDPKAKNNPDTSKPEEPQAPAFKRSSQSNTLRKAGNVRPTDQMRDMLSRMRDIEADPDDPGYPEPEPTTDISTNVTTENLPSVINNALTKDGMVTPEWHTVANLPGNMAQGIRTLGRRLFRSMTRTPTDDIIMIGNVMSMGPNDSREINSVASWLRNTGQEVSSGDIDFDNIIPGYRADIKMYKAAGGRFLLVRDQYGQYIYTWPEQDSVDGGNQQMLPEDEVLDRPPVNQPQEIELDKPGGFNVVLLNDPVTPAEVVVEAIRSVVGLSQQAAMKRMMRAHRGGWHVVATYASSDVAETVAERLMAHCRGNTNYDHYRNYPGVPQYPRGPGGFQGPWPTQFDVMEAGG